MATRVLNRQRLKRKLTAIPDAVKGEIRKALEEGAEEIARMARSLVPVGSTGHLHDSIGWTWGDSPKGSIAIATVGGPNDLRIVVYAGDEKAYYARWVEFGTSLGQPPQPFFFPAYRAVRKRIKAKVNRAVKAAAKKVAGMS